VVSSRKLPDFPYASKAFDRDGLTMRYVDEGRGPAVLMVHGNPTWSFYFRRLIGALRDRCRVVAPDHIGMGRSDKPGDDRYRYTLRSRIDDLEALVEHLDLDDVTLVVHDWGGAIGMGWAARNPGRVRRIVAMNTAAFRKPAGKSFPPSLTLARLPGAGAALVRGANAFVRGANRFCVTRRPLPRDVAAAYLQPFPTWDSRIAVHRFVEDIPLHPRDEAYSALVATENGLSELADRPVMLCWGMKDFIFDHHFLDQWVEHFPHATVHRFDDCGHYVLEDAHEQIVPLIESFIAEGDRPRVQP
jgi:haloalkane dehalogenase